MVKNGMVQRIMSKCRKVLIVCHCSTTRFANYLMSPLTQLHHDREKAVQPEQEDRQEELEVDLIIIQ